MRSVAAVGKCGQNRPKADGWSDPAIAMSERNRSGSLMRSEGALMSAVSEERLRTCPRCSATVSPGASDCASCGSVLDRHGGLVPQLVAAEASPAWFVRWLWVYLSFLCLTAAVTVQWRLPIWPLTLVAILGVSPLYGAASKLLQSTPRELAKLISQVVVPVAVTIAVVLWLTPWRV